MASPPGLTSRPNNLKISADVDDYAGSLDVAGLITGPIDLKSASLRGKVEAASARIDLRQKESVKVACR